MEEQTQVKKMEEQEIKKYRSVRDEKMFNLEIDNITDNNSQVKKVYDDVFPSLLEMGNIKTDFDCLLFTAGEQGNDAKQFPASTFHFICRQMRFSIFESKRLERDMREYKRRIEALKDESSPQYKKCIEDGNFPDLEIEKLQDQFDASKIDFFNRASRTVRFKQIHDRLIELNDNKPFTNEQYQQEQPRYYKWFLSNKFAQDIVAKSLGVSKGLIHAVQRATQEPLLEDIVEPVDHFIEIIDREDGHFEFKLKMDDIFKGGICEKQMRKMTAEEKKKIEALKQQKLLIQQQQQRAIQKHFEEKNRIAQNPVFTVLQKETTDKIKSLDNGKLDVVDPSEIKIDK